MDNLIKDFIKNGDGQYAILQLYNGPETALEQFSSIKELDRMGIRPNSKHYSFVYSAKIPKYDNKTAFLERIYAKFNMEKPFTGHSLSVSDIILLHENGEIGCYFVDSIGFAELPDFLH